MAGRKKSVDRDDIVIDVKNISKRFILPHERDLSLKSSVINLYKKKTYETFFALKNVSFDVKRGEFLGIIGRNGSGKSTLLKILAGIYEPDLGKVIVKEKISPFLELGVGFNAELSGRENIFLSAAVLGISDQDIHKRFDDIVRFAELERFIDTKLKNYSSGMQVRLAFSVAIQADAPILLVDEVLAVGDADFQKKCFDVFTRFKKEKKTVVFVSHDLSSVGKWCDRCILLDDSRIIFDGKNTTAIKHYQKKVLGIKTIKKIKNDEKPSELVSKQDVLVPEPELKNIKDSGLPDDKKDKDESKPNPDLKTEEIEGYLKEISILKISNDDLMSQVENLKKTLQNYEKKILLSYVPNSPAPVVIENAVEITKVSACDISGKGKILFNKGDDIIIEIRYRLLKDIKALNFGVAIRDANNILISGNNTFRDNFKIKRKNGIIRFIIKQNPLNTGEYFGSISAFSDNEDIVYMFRQNCLKFKIINKDYQKGIMTVKHAWTEND